MAKRCRMSRRCDECIIFAIPDDECLFYGTPTWCVNMGWVRAWEVGESESLP